MSDRYVGKRNVFTKLDDLGLYSNIPRLDGESLTNYQARIQAMNTGAPGSRLSGLTHAIASLLGLGQAALIKITAYEDLKVDVTSANITVSGTQYRQVPLITLDPDGEWKLPTVTTVVSGLNNISGVIATEYSVASGLPAFVLEAQSSYIEVDAEQVLKYKTFQLGQQQNINLTNAQVITDRVEFTDLETYRVQVSGTPQKQGEWSVSQTGQVNVFEPPEDFTFVNYTYNLLPSGQSMDLIGNGVKILNTADPEIQELMFYASGIGYTGQQITDEILNVDKTFWGK